MRQGCVTCSCLFNIFFDRVVRQMNERAMGRGIKLRDQDRGSWEIKQVLNADDSFGSRNKRAPQTYCE